MESPKSDPYLTLYHQVARPALYCAPWWLDATCGEKGWSAVYVYDETGTPVAALPFGNTRIRGMSAVITPPFTQWVSILQRTPEHQAEIGQLLSGLPRSAIMDLSFRSAVDVVGTQHLSQATLKYSYLIPIEKEIDQIRSGYNEGLRRNIRQAEKDYLVSSSVDISTFLSLCHQSYRTQHLHPPPWLDRVVQNVFLELNARQCGSLMFATMHDKPIAGILTAWDQDTCYYLAGGRTPDDQGASAHALLLDQAIHSAQKRALAFDFEGSMHPGIANFFQSFGARPVSYWNIRQFRGLGRLWALMQ